MSERVDRQGELIYLNVPASCDICGQELDANGDCPKKCHEKKAQELAES